MRGARLRENRGLQAGPTHANAHAFAFAGARVCARACARAARQIVCDLGLVRDERYGTREAVESHNRRPGKTSRNALSFITHVMKDTELEKLQNHTGLTAARQIVCDLGRHGDASPAVYLTARLQQTSTEVCVIVGVCVRARVACVCVCARAYAHVQA